MIDLHDFLRSRRSIRNFSKQAVSRDLVDKILETASWAPSAHNRQPWRFIVLLEDKTKQDLADAMAVDYRSALASAGMETAEINRRVQRRKDRLCNAPVGILLCMDITVMDSYDDKNRHEGEIQMAIQSVALAGGTILLAAHASGLGAVWTCAPLFVQDIVRQTLNLPDEWFPQALILMGYPDEEPGERERIPFSELTRYV